MARELAEIRIDKWLWAVRLFKTRTLATDGCRSGKVMITGRAVKPSRPVKVGDLVQIKQPPIIREYQVLALAERRVSAALARELVEETTPPEDLKKMRLARRDPLYFLIAQREKGMGRPTKKERRDLEKFSEEDKEKF